MIQMNLLTLGFSLETFLLLVVRMALIYITMHRSFLIARLVFQALTDNLKESSFAFGSYY